MFNNFKDEEEEDNEAADIKNGCLTESG